MAIFVGGEPGRRAAERKAREARARELRTHADAARRRAERAQLASERRIAWDAERARREEQQREAAATARAAGVEFRLRAIHLDPPADFMPLPPEGPAGVFEIRLPAGYGEDERGRVATTIEEYTADADEAAALLAGQR